MFAKQTGTTQSIHKMKSQEKNSPERYAKWVFRIVIMVMILGSALMLASCNEDKTPDLNVQSNTPVFDIAQFEDNVKSYIMWNNDQPVGWAYAISKDGKLQRYGAFGDARTSADGQLDFKMSKEINVASVSKFYTAIAVMQLLDKNGLTIEDKIITYLPGAWSKGTGVGQLTFKELLTHTSGLQSTNTNFSTTLSYDGLKTCIQTGVINPKTRNYLNANFALFRIIIPSLWSKLNNGPNVDLNDENDCTNKYLSYMQQFVFDPVTLSNITCEPEDRSQCTLYYNVNDGNNGTKGSYYGSWSSMCGGGGYFMSTLEMSAMLAYFEHTEKLVSKDIRDIMKDNRIGMDLADPSDEKHGNYYGKNGSIANGANQGVVAQMVMFPLNGVDCVVVMNTQGTNLKGTSSLRQMIYDAYNDAWITP